jgi:OHCU decarboxylase
MAASRPFRSIESLAAAADRTWRELSKADWLEAFDAHPAIGSEQVEGTGLSKSRGQVPKGPAPAAVQGLHPPPNSAHGWPQQEQSGTRDADPQTLEELSKLNREYADRFGRVFLVCATGKSAAEMLALGRKRLENDPETELAVAAEEQRKITRLRLEKLVSPTER